MIADESTHEAWFRAHVHQVVTEAFGETETDEDGDYFVPGEPCGGWIKPMPTGPGGVVISINVAGHTPNRVGVLREINEASRANPAINVTGWPGGIVCASWFVPAQGLSAAMLELAVVNVIGFADDLGPMLTAVHGGVMPRQPKVDQDAA